MQRIAELTGSQLGRFQIISVGFVDHNTVRHFHDSAFDSLQFISRTCELNQQEEIHHRMNRRFALSYSNGFHKDFIESGSFAKHNGFTGLPCNSSQ